MVQTLYSVLRAKHLREFAGVVTATDPADREAFKEILCAAVHQYGFTLVEVAQFAKVDRSTVGRWVSKDHDTLPLGVAPFVIRDWLFEQLHKRAKDLE